MTTDKVIDIFKLSIMIIGSFFGIFYFFALFEAYEAGRSIKVNVFIYWFYLLGGKWIVSIILFLTGVNAIISLIKVIKTKYEPD